MIAYKDENRVVCPLLVVYWTFDPECIETLQQRFLPPGTTLVTPPLIDTGGPN